jgi:hypothetical protein
MTVALGAYCALAPTAIELAETNYQWKTSFVRNPQWHLNRAREAVKAIRDDAVKMAAIRTAVKEQISQADAAAIED